MCCSCLPQGFELEGSSLLRTWGCSIWPCVGCGKVVGSPVLSRCSCTSAKLEVEVPPKYCMKNIGTSLPGTKHCQMSGFDLWHVGLLSLKGRRALSVCESPSQALLWVSFGILHCRASVYGCPAGLCVLHLSSACPGERALRPNLFCRFFA